MKKLTSRLIELTTLITLEITAMRWICASFSLWGQRRLTSWDGSLGCLLRSCSGRAADICSLCPAGQHCSADVDELPACDRWVLWNQPPERFNCIPLLSTRLPALTCFTHVGRADSKHLAGCSCWWCCRMELLCQQSGAVVPRDGRS